MTVDTIQQLLGSRRLRPPGSECRRNNRKRPASQAEDIQHGRVALLLEFRRKDKLALGRWARSRCDRDVLFAVDLECHWRCCKAGPNIDLPQLLERGVVEGRRRAVPPCEKTEPPPTFPAPATIRSAQTHPLSAP